MGKNWLEWISNIEHKIEHEHVVVKCYKVMSSQKFKGGKKTPQYALYAASNDVISFWGASYTFLAWYADAEQLEKEIAEIKGAATTTKNDITMGVFTC